MAAGTFQGIEQGLTEISIPESIYKGQYLKDARQPHVYKNKYTEEWYKIYKENDTWSVETWMNGCGCE